MPNGGQQAYPLYAIENLHVFLIQTTRSEKLGPQLGQGQVEGPRARVANVHARLRPVVNPENDKRLARTCLAKN